MAERWSKLKKRVESFFAPEIEGRVELWSTKYRVPLEGIGRGWFTLDGEEVFSCCTLRQLTALYRLRTGEELPHGEHSQLLQMPPPSTEERSALHAEQLYSQDEYYEALEQYPNLPIELALNSTNLLVRILALLDRRVGARRLRRAQSSEEPAEPLKLFLLARLGTRTGSE